jgi:hypothetical protein
MGRQIVHVNPDHLQFTVKIDVDLDFPRLHTVIVALGVNSFSWWLYHDILAGDTVCTRENIPGNPFELVACPVKLRAVQSAPLGSAAIKVQILAQARIVVKSLQRCTPMESQLVKKTRRVQGIQYSFMENGLGDDRK